MVLQSTLFACLFACARVALRQKVTPYQGSFRAVLQSMPHMNQPVLKFTWIDGTECVVNLVPMRRGHFKVYVPTEPA